MAVSSCPNGPCAAHELNAHPACEPHPRASLVEGNSIGDTSRLTGASRTTVLSLLVDLGDLCRVYQDHVLGSCPASGFSATKSGVFADEGQAGEGRSQGRGRRVDLDGHVRRFQADGVVAGRDAPEGDGDSVSARPARTTRQSRPADHGRPQRLLGRGGPGLWDRRGFRAVGEGLRQRAKLWPLQPAYLQRGREDITSGASPTRTTSRPRLSSGPA